MFIAQNVSQTFFLFTHFANTINQQSSFRFRFEHHSFIFGIFLDNLVNCRTRYIQLFRNARIRLSRLKFDVFISYSEIVSESELYNLKDFDLWQLLSYSHRFLQPFRGASFEFRFRFHQLLIQAVLFEFTMELLSCFLIRLSLLRNGTFHLARLTLSM